MSRPFLAMATFTGFRSSEGRALTLSAVDFDRKKIIIRERVDKWGDVDSTKSYHGQREIPIPDYLVNTLREWKAICPKSDGDLVFPNGSGNIENHQNVIKRVLHPAWLAAGVTVQQPKVDKEGNAVLGDDGEPIIETVPKYTGLHALRHFFASWCINRKASGGMKLTPKEVQYRMGHSSIQQTMDTYGHLFPDHDEHESLAAADLLSVVSAT